MARFVADGQKISADHHFSVRLQHDRPDGQVRPAARIEARIDRAIPPQAGYVGTGRVIDVDEVAAEQNHAVGLDRDGKHAVAGPEPWVEGEIYGTVGVEAGDIVSA